jgi:putative DNA primase/helicase
LLQSDARPLLYDEADVDDQRDKDRVQSILALARASSSKSGGKIAKGTQTGSAYLTDPRSCFALSSIGLQLVAGADKTRFTILGLQRFEGIRSTEEFNDFSNKWFENVDADFVKNLQARTLNLMPTILRNANVFKNAVTEHIGSRRLGDQVGILLAGAYSLTSTESVDYSDALEFVKSKDWSEEKSVESTKDEMQLFNTIMSSIIRIDGNYERSIGELIMKQAGLITDHNITNTENTLRRLGVLVVNDKIYISNSSNHIKKIVRDTSWSNNYGKLLRRIDGAESVNARTYEIGVSSQRGTSIPLYLISDGANRIMDDSEYLNKKYEKDAPF